MKSSKERNKGFQDKMKLRIRENNENKFFYAI